MSDTVEDFLVEHADSTIDSMVSAESDDLKQYGILGMKWGRRRPRGRDGRVVDGPPPPKNAPERRKEKRASTATRPPSVMTDEELRARLNRLQMERQYAEFMKNPPRSKHPAEKFIVDVLTNSGKTAATKYATRVLEASIAAALSKSNSEILKKAVGETKKKNK